MPTGARTLMSTAMSTIARQDTTDLDIEVLPDGELLNAPLRAIVAIPVAGLPLRAELHPTGALTGRRTDLLITLPDGTTTVPTNADDVRTTITNWLHTIPAAA